MNNAEQDSKNVVRVLNENVLIFDPKEQDSPSYFRYGHVMFRLYPYIVVTPKSYNLI